MKRQKIPYGDANFEQIRLKNYLYVDKTKYIELLEEEPKYIFFIRPRRFGKSLFISMLECYYDINRKDKFEELFGDLYIGKNPTPEKNDYLILRFDFSTLVTGQGKARFYKSFDNYITDRVNAFFRYYSDLLKINELPREKHKAELSISYLFSILKGTKYKLYLLIDEYDNFANNLIKPIDTLTSDSDDFNYNTLIKSESYLRTFFKTLKEFVQNYPSRLFMTGVSPIMLDDLSSGFNITTNITINEKFNGILGFTHEEVRGILMQTGIDNAEIERVMKDLHYHYNGYLFAKRAKTKMFNSDMFLYFLLEYQRKGEYPDEMLDYNVKTDYSKIQAMAFNFRDEKTIDQLLREKETISLLIERFEMEKMYSDINNFKSLLFYLGMLTIKGLNEFGETVLCVPNYVAQRIYWEYFAAQIREYSGIQTSDIQGIIGPMRVYGNIKPFIEFVQEVLSKLSNRDLQKFDEKYIKVVMFTLLNLDGFYLLQSEPELRNGYADLLLTRSRQFVKYTKYEWLIEIKYIKESERKNLDKIRKKGIEQVKNYTESENIQKRFENEGLKKALICFIGKGEALVNEI